MNVKPNILDLPPSRKVADRPCRVRQEERQANCFFQNSEFRIQNSRRQAFTLLEVLTVIAVILILIGLIFGAWSKLQSSNKRTLTIARMQILDSMLSELQAAGSNTFKNQWFMQAGPYVNAYNYGNVTTDNSNGISQPTALVPPESLLVNGTSTPVASGGRQEAIDDLTVGTGAGAYTSSYPSNLTQGIMTQLAALPNNAKTLAGLPSGSTATNAQFQPSSPVILDGWNNPIIFVPVGGLQGVYVNIVVNGVNPTTGQRQAPSGTPSGTITSPDGRPFWASAGPDGDFVRGDDNIYSFNPQ
jgi:prepilin-type N-terminal cleavage/methylation domain-containing protein